MTINRFVDGVLTHAPPGWFESDSERVICIYYAILPSGKHAYSVALFLKDGKPIKTLTVQQGYNTFKTSYKIENGYLVHGINKWELELLGCIEMYYGTPLFKPKRVFGGECDVCEKVLW